MMQRIRRRRQKWRRKWMVKLENRKIRIRKKEAEKEARK